MTQVVVLPIIDGKKPSQSAIKIKLSKVFEGAVNKDSTYKKGWNPFIQSFIRQNGAGDYTVVHNLNNKNYCVSVGLISEQASYELSEVGEVSFRLKITKNKEPINADFRFCISMMETDG